jgi:hypothetical protein
MSSVPPAGPRKHELPKETEMKYMIMTFGDQSGLEGKSPEWIKGMIEFMQRIDVELTDSGELVFQQGLADPPQAGDRTGGVSPAKSAPGTTWSAGAGRCKRFASQPSGRNGSPICTGAWTASQRMRSPPASASCSEPVSYAATPPTTGGEDNL